MPQQTALGFVPRADVIRPTCREDEEDFIPFGIWEFRYCAFQRVSYQGFFSLVLSAPSE
jgi:hypothetical protein